MVSLRSKPHWAVTLVLYTQGQTWLKACWPLAAMAICGESCTPNQGVLLRTDGPDGSRCFDCFRYSKE